MKGNYLHTHSQELSVWHSKSDGEIWTAFLKGDKSAYEFIYQNYVDELFSYGMSVRLNRSLVKDSIQDLFIDLWNRRKFLSVTDNIKFYLYRALRRKIKYFVEREKRLFEEKSYESFPQAEMIFPFEHHLISQQINEEKKKQIKLALSKLSDRQREIINLIFFEQLSYEEISEILLINIKSVYTLSWKAVTSLKKILNGMLILLITGLVN